MDKKSIRAMTEEEYQEYLMDSLSDAVRSFAHKITLLKALANAEQNIKPEDFDRAFEKELAKEWDKVKNKTKNELAVMGMLEMLASGMPIEEFFGESEEE